MKEIESFGKINIKDIKIIFENNSYFDANQNIYKCEEGNHNY